MRPHLLAAALAIAAPLALAAHAPDARADFDPSGRRKPGRPGGKPGKPGGRPGKPPAKPGGAEKAGRKGPSADVLIARYTAAALQKPGEPFPIQRLAQLYRERDGNLSKLVEDFEKRAGAGGPDAWAAKVSLAGIHRQDGRLDEAEKAYEAATAEKPKEPAPRLALAQLSADRGDKQKARDHYEKALPLLKASVDVEQTRRTLLGLCLDLKNFEAAKKHHDALVKSTAGSLFVKAELGRELMNRGEHARAEAEFRELVKAASGDNRALAPALRDLGKSLAKQRKMKEALSTLKRAFDIAGQAAGIRAEILVVMADAFRAENKLPELIGILEKEPGQDFQRLVTLGALYEETGNVTKAMATYRRALAQNGKHIDTRLKLVHLLQASGELDSAIKEYENLIKAAPGNHEYVFELCETLIQRGDRPKALKLLGELEARAKDPDTLAAVADFYERVEEKDKALKVFQRLAQTGGVDAQHIVDLGDRYFQAGDKKKALETWARIKTVEPNRARAALLLGEVYLDHDMPNEALTSIREAVAAEPKNLRYKKSLAIALERTATSRPNPRARYAEARVVWQELLEAAAGSGDKLLARESRQHIVSLWSLTGELSGRVPELSRKFSASPPDLEAGRLLAEVQRKLGRLPESETTLRKVIAGAPGDEEAHLALERVLRQQGNLRGAIDVLAKLATVNPKRALECYQRMAQYAAELYRDDEAIEYAAKAVALSPNNAGGHQKLGEMYKKRQDVPRAIAAFRQALSQNPRLWPVHFELAELLLSTGAPEDADRLYRQVVRGSPDEELVSRAARLSMQINLGRGSLEVLERELLPVAVGNPGKPIYRRLLVELYGAMTFPLVQKARRGASAEAAQSARAELAKVGARAVKPLLDALADERESQQKIAIEVLAYVANKGAGPALYNFATGTADKALRVRAMVACGALRDPALLGRFEKLLLPEPGSAVVPNDAVAVAAAWGVARLGDRKALPLLEKLLESSSPEVRALGALGLGLSQERRYAPALAELARSPEAGSLARAAALFALAELSPAGSSGELPLFLSLADSGDPALRSAALAALGRYAPGTSTGAADAIAAGAFSADEEVRRAALSAALALHAKEPRRAAELPMPDGPLVVRALLEGLGRAEASSAEKARAAASLGPSLRKAAVAAVSTSPERARVVADALLGSPKALTLAPFTDREVPELSAVVEDVASAVVPAFVALVRHPDLEVRTRAIELLARRPEPAAQAAVVDALGDPAETVGRAALAAIGPVAHAPTAEAVAKVLTASKSWPMRVRAAEALGRLGASGKGTLGEKVAVALASAAKKDDYALVREAAARALASFDEAAAAPLLRDLAATDAEPRVRKTASELLSAQK